MAPDERGRPPAARTAVAPTSIIGSSTDVHDLTRVVAVEVLADAVVRIDGARAIMRRIVLAQVGAGPYAAVSDELLRWAPFVAGEILRSPRRALQRALDVAPGGSL
jgi:hypothetical protein